MAAGLDKYHIIVTQKASDKVLKTIRYVLYTLKYIPNTITIYEDRPQRFLEYRDLIEKVL
jgi:hypothetical protein